MALNNGIWDPKPRVTNIQGTNLKSLRLGRSWLGPTGADLTRRQANQTRGLGFKVFCPLRLASKHAAFKVWGLGSIGFRAH